MTLAHLAEALRILDQRHLKAMLELHSELHERVSVVLANCGGRFKAWQGFRGPSEQEAAFLQGNSNAKFGESPHNWLPSLAVDVVLDPRNVEVRERPDAPDWPDEWDNESPSALEAWRVLELYAREAGLERVTLPGGHRDLPHLQLPDWRSFIPH